MSHLASTVPIPPNNSRVLSIQSHVVSGYVGNKAAVFPLQLLGFDVDVINSVHFSNHTGYPYGVEGDVLQGAQLEKIFDGLKRNGLVQNIGHVLTGYIGSVSFLRAVVHVIQSLRLATGNRVRFVCDPVLGDNGKFYVPLELVAVYKAEVLPIADVVTPNQFEVEQLTGIKIKSIDDAKLACQKLHDMGPKLVVITSVMLPDVDGGIRDIAVLASKRDGNTKDDQIWCIKSFYIEGHFTGTGDLCAALLLAWTELEVNNIQHALEKAIGTMFSVIQRTAKSAAENEADGVLSRELRLIQSKRDIEEPPALFKATRL